MGAKQSTSREDSLQAERDIWSQASPQRGVITRKQLRDRDGPNRPKIMEKSTEYDTESERTVKPQLFAHLT